MPASSEASSGAVRRREYASDRDRRKARGSIMRPDGEALTDVRPGLAQPEPAGTGERLRLYALVSLTVLLIGLCVGLAVPFLPAITWGVALAILAWPMHRRIGRHVARPGLAAAFST